MHQDKTSFKLGLTNEDLGLLTTSLAYLIFGNLIDNYANHRILIISCDLTIGLLYLLYSAAILIHNDASSSLEEGLVDSLIQNLKFCLYATGPCIYLMIWLQLFNWFPKK